MSPRWSRRDRPRSLARGWSRIASVWVHLAVLLALATTAAPVTPASAPAEPTLVERIVAERAVGTTGGALQGGAASADAEAGTSPPRVVGPIDARPARAPSPDARTPRRDLAPPRTSPPLPTADEDEDAVPFVRTEEDEASPEAPPDAVAISAHHRAAEVHTRTPVTADDRGPVTLQSDGTEELAASPTPVRHPGAERAAAGRVPTAERPTRTRVSAGGGGGRRGLGRAAGAQVLGGDRAEGGPATAASAASGGDGAPALAGVPIAPLAARPTAPSWWRPLAVRVTVQRREGRAPGAPRAAADTQGTERALVESIGARADRGGTATPEPRAEALPAAPAPEPGTPGPELWGASDPVVELRDALGWGGLDRSELAPRPSWAGTLGGRSARPTSPQLALDELPLDWTAAVSAVGTPLGAYIQRVEDLVAARWKRADLAPHARALGIQGEVAVRYRVRRNGVVEDKRVARSSGNPQLDAMALAAIPRKLPRFPRDLTEEVVHHQLLLRYRNPLLGDTPAQAPSARIRQP